MSRKSEGPAHGSRRGEALNAQLGGESNSEIIAGIVRAQGGTALYYHDRRLGFLIDHRHGVDAVTANGGRLGRFNSPEAAARALAHEAAR